MIWWPYFISWSKRSLSRCRLMDHILCKWRLLRQYFEWVGVFLGEWDIILGGWRWVGVYGALFWVGGGGWVHCLIMPVSEGILRVLSMVSDGVIFYEKNICHFIKDFFITRFFHKSFILCFIGFPMCLWILFSEFN